MSYLYYDPLHPAKDDKKGNFICGVGNSLALPNIQSFLAVSQPPTVAHVTVDTRELCKPNVALEFSCNLTTTVEVGNLITVEFQLSRICPRRPEVALQNWTYCLGVLVDDASPPPPPPPPETEPDVKEKADPVIRQGGFLEGLIHKCETVSFNYCECAPCPDCCEYLVKVVGLFLSGYITVPGESLSLAVTNVELNVFLQP